MRQDMFLSIFILGFLALGIVEASAYWRQVCKYTGRGQLLCNLVWVADQADKWRMYNERSGLNERARKQRENVQRQFNYYYPNVWTGRRNNRRRNYR